MAEEQKWQEPGSHTLCANNCGFFGSPTTFNLCSKCYEDRCMKEQQLKEAKMAMEKTLSQADSSSCSPSLKPFSLSPSSSPSDIELNSPKPGVVLESSASTSIVAADISAGMTAAAAHPNRCATCRRRVGLTGFKCRCGVTFCGSHRYPERHGCTFDYKALGREAIAKANPVVKAEKLDKI